MATSIVFLDAHVSEVAKDGTRILRREMTLTNETPHRTRKDRGLEMSLGSGHPDENNNTNNCSFLLGHLVLLFEKEVDASKNDANRL